MNLTIPAQNRRKRALERLNFQSNKTLAHTFYLGREKEIETIKSRLNMPKNESTEGSRKDRKRRNKNF